MTTRTRARTRLVVGTAVCAVLLTFLLSGCGGDGAADIADGAETTETAAAPTLAERAAALDPDAVQYVALGDSYTAAPGVPTTDDAQGCYRSDHNFPHLLAEDRDDVALLDVSCSGATSEDVTEGRSGSGGDLPPQIDALTAETDYVTVGIGGNDFNLFTQLLGTCYQAASSDPDGAPCRKAAEADVGDDLTGIGTNVEKLLDAVTAAAPNAKVILVGYPRLLVAGSTCPDLVSLATGDYAFVQEVIDGLDDELESAAKGRDVTFLDLRGPSKGHDICSKDPWINGQKTAPDGTIPFHPLAEGQVGVAASVEELLGS